MHSTRHLQHPTQKLAIKVATLTPPICKLAVSVVCTAILRRMLYAYCAAAKGLRRYTLGPTNVQKATHCLMLALTSTDSNHVFLKCSDDLLFGGIFGLGVCTKQKLATKHM